MTATIHWHGVQGGQRGSWTTTINNYPSGEPVINFPRDAYVEKLMMRPMSMLDFMGGLFFIDALLERGQSPPVLILPFVPGARQDRMNSEGDFLFTAKSIAKEINARGLKRVTILDPHSEVISGMIDRCHIIHAHECLRRDRPGTGTYRGDLRIEMAAYQAVISPDSGAEKRAGAVAKALGLPLVHGWKTRDVATGKITGFGLERAEVSGYVLVVDDICDGGGTFIGLSSVIKERGLKADLFVTHGIFSQGTTKLLEQYERVFCTDSIDGDRPGVEVIRTCKKLFEGTF